jgi:hypothetical protein
MTDNIENSITKSISTEIVQTSVDLGADYAEMTLDEIFSGKILEEIPIVKTLYSIGKIGLSIKERFFVKKLLVFLKEMHSKKIPDEKLNNFKYHFDTDIKYRNKVTEHIIVYTEAFTQVDKAKVFSKLFRAYIEGQFQWEYFLSLSSCLNSINPAAFPFLEKLSMQEYFIAPEGNKVERQEDTMYEALLYSSGIAFVAGGFATGVGVSKLGKDLFEFGIK